MSDDHSVRALIEELSGFQAEMLRGEEELAEQISGVCDLHRESARNLGHYIALRRHDVRDLRERLTANGLSSLGRAEADVLGAIDAVLWALHRIAGKHDSVATAGERGSRSGVRGWDLLERDTEELFGPAPNERQVRIPREFTTNALF